MKEIKNILAAYDTAVKTGKKTALATVVHVEGSSYRRPGARMLVTEDGLLTGAISGGCLEGDALRKALLAIQQRQNKLVTYDTTDDDNTIGVQLGCNGIVHILFEPLETGSPNAIDLLRETVTERKVGAIATMFSMDNREFQPGTLLSTNNLKNAFAAPSLPAELIELVSRDVTQAVDNEASELKEYNSTAGKLNALIQVIQPAISVLIFGAGNDAIPLANILHGIGWNVLIADGRQTHATAKRFPEADRIVITNAENSLDEMTIDNLTAAVLMTHNYNYDIKVLERLLSTPCRYIGILGPAKKMQKMYDELAERNVYVRAEDAERIYSPVGIDMGAETAEEIALSIAAEIKAVFSGTMPQSLKLKDGPIHMRNEQASNTYK